MQTEKKCTFVRTIVIADTLADCPHFPKSNSFITAINERVPHWQSKVAAGDKPQ
jgi:hypothetical protein